MRAERQEGSRCGQPHVTPHLPRGNQEAMRVSGGERMGESLYFQSDKKDRSCCSVECESKVGGSGKGGEQEGGDLPFQGHMEIMCVYVGD